MASNLHQLIRAAREEASLTREQMAPKLGVTVSTLRNYEIGKTERISVETVAMIARITGKPLSFFLDGGVPV